MQASYIGFIVVMLIILYMARRRNNILIMKKVLNKRNSKEKIKMVELAKRFIDTECLIYTFDNHQYTGVIKEVTDGAVLLENKGKTEALNLDFVLRIREYPTNKKGKKKSVVLD